MRRTLVSLVSVLVLVASLAVGSAFAAGTKSVRASHVSATAALDLGVLDQLNKIRAEHHLVPLSLSPKLSLAAAMHSKDMLANGYFAHDSSNDSPFWKRIRDYYPESRYGYWSVGENLFWSTGLPSVEAGMSAWMHSPEHRANILNPAWRQIGIAAVTSPDAPGTYAGLAATVITTDFGVRR
jgi:uncharacterized protein YkwD